MLRRSAALLLAGLLAGCATAPPLPPFLSKPYEPFSRAEALAVAWREWRLWGSLTDEANPGEAAKPERAPGLWSRVGEYWWIGLGGRLPEAGWTGKHDAAGRVFPPEQDAHYAWSAAFISYVMRLAGAGDLFPYAPDHAAYVEAAASGRARGLGAEDVTRVAPVPGDLVCYARDWAKGLRLADLPLGRHWPGHCALVVATAPGRISVISGNSEDAVRLTHVPVSAEGRLAASDGISLDPRYSWFVVLRVLYRTDGLARSPVTCDRTSAHAPQGESIAFAERRA